MIRFFARRLFVSVLVALTVSIVAFSFLRLSGDLPALLAGENAKPDEIARIAHQYGLDAPLYVQYLAWAGSALHGDLGRSLFSGEPVTQLLVERIGVTLTLALGALILALAVAVPLGVFAAVNANSWRDRAAMSLAVAGQAIPNFWFALILIYVFGVACRLVPISGSDSWQNFILPIVTLAFTAMPAFMRLTRAGMLDVLSSDYIRTARAKGLRPVSILFKHALRNAILPIVSVAAVQLGFLLGGSVIVESVFALNGIGLALAFRLDHQRGFSGGAVDPGVSILRLHRPYTARRCDQRVARSAHQAKSAMGGSADTSAAIADLDAGAAAVVAHDDAVRARGLESLAVTLGGGYRAADDHRRDLRAADSALRPLRAGPDQPPGRRPVGSAWLLGACVRH